VNLPLTIDSYAKGLRWEDYLSRMTSNQDLARNLYGEARLTPEDRTDLEQAILRHGGRIYLSAMTEPWCGDSAANLPMIARLASELSGVELRIFVRHEHPDLQAAYEADGIDRIPTVSVFDASFHELGRWVERPKAANARIEAWKTGYPELEALGKSPNPEDKKRRRAIYDGLLDEMVVWYRGGMWNETVRELKEILLPVDVHA